MTTKTTAWYTRTYTERFGFALVPIAEKSKRPIGTAWGENAITDPDAAERYWAENPTHNVGLRLTDYCSMDIDNSDALAIIFEEFGIPHDALAGYPTIQGASKGSRVLFKRPADTAIAYHKLTWPNEQDHDGSKHKALIAAARDAKDAGDTVREADIREQARAIARFTVLELRTSDGKEQRQDVLPPSIHPDTGKPYRWVVQPPKDGAWPEPPGWLMAIWEAWDSFAPQLVDACPWKPQQKREPAKAKPRQQDQSGAADIIAAYEQAHPVREALEFYGYKRVGKRYLSPYSSTGLAGVTVLDDSRCFIHHASDPLCSGESGRPASSFDLFRVYEHDGDIGKAVKAAAIELGMEDERRPAPVPPPMPDRAPVQESQADAPQPRMPWDHAEFSVLGYNNGGIYILPRRTEQVTRISAGAVSKSSMLQLASLEWWETEFPTKTGADWDAAANTLLRWAETAGIYDPRRERGRGAWYDSGRPVLHLGNRLMIDGEAKAISEHKSRYVYTRAAELDNAWASDAATARDGETVTALIARLRWQKPEHGMLASGWAFLAPVCGALTWRPHLWLTAQRGAGKSWTQTFIIAPLAGESTLLRCQGSTTEAGIRQALRQDARPVMFDEAEGEDVSALKRIKGVIELARMSSSDTDADVLKGAANGDGVAYVTRAMFLMGSINVALRQSADETRFSVVSLTQAPKTGTEPERFEQLERDVKRTLTPQFCASIRARAYRMIPVIRDCAKLLARAVAERLGSQRAGDQVGTLLAGWWCLAHDALPTSQQIDALLDGFDPSDAIESEEERDEINCLLHILQSQVRVDEAGATMTRSIGELVELVRHGHGGSEAASDTLGRHGLRVSGRELMIANRHKELDRLLKDTPWEASHRRLLLRIDGAHSFNNKTVWFGGSAAKVTVVPLDCIQ